ncbi:MAG TPA: TetR/AcrR family transcriptional regulator [Microbacteriaceae bacterium]
MAGRGSYAKGLAKREEILRSALEVFSRQGYRGTSLRELAKAVNLSQAGILHYFDSKEQLFAEILRKRDELDGARYAETDEAAHALVAVMRHNAEVPGLVQLYANISAAATEADHPAHDYFVRRYDGMRRMFADSIRTQQTAGQFPAELDADMIATVMIATADGMQVQWMLDPERDMSDHLEYLWSLLSGIHQPDRRPSESAQ